MLRLDIIYCVLTYLVTIHTICCLFNSISIYFLLYIHTVYRSLFFDNAAVRDKLPYYKRNYGKYVTEIISKTCVDFVFYANGIVYIHAECSRRPFELQTEEDRSRLLVFLDRLEAILLTS